MILFLALTAAHSADLVVQGSADTTVLVDTVSAGTTPLRQELPPGRHVLGFRGPQDEQTLFGLVVNVPDTAGTLEVTVDRDARTAETKMVSWPRLMVTSTPSGATILVDGDPTGQTTPSTLELPPGPHDIEARSDCMLGSARTTLTPDAMSQLNVRLDGPQLKVESAPEGATVRVDGDIVGQAPTQHEVTCGEHTVDVRAAGHLPFHQLVDTQATVTVTATLEPGLVGALEVQPNWPESPVFVDGNAFGPGPVFIEALEVGPHAVRVGDEEQEVVISSVPTQVRLGPAAPPQASVQSEASVTPKVRRKRGGPVRIIVNTALSSAAIGLAGAAFYNHAQARKVYTDYRLVPDDRMAHRLYEDNLRPRRRLIVAETITASVLGAGSAALWLTTDF